MRMADKKQVKWVDSSGKEAGPDLKKGKASLEPDQPAANDADGWQKYRHWISKAPAPRSRRSGIDPALYSWKGYRDWSEQIKRNWIKNTDDE